jgi:hypothetical protein
MLEQNPTSHWPWPTPAPLGKAAPVPPHPGLHQAPPRALPTIQFQSPNTQHAIPHRTLAPAVDDIKHATIHMVPPRRDVIWICAHQPLGWSCNSLVRRCCRTHKTKNTILECSFVITTYIQGLWAPIITHQILCYVQNLTFSRNDIETLNAGLSILLPIAQKLIKATATCERNQNWDGLLDGLINPSVVTESELHHNPPITNIDSWNHVEGTISSMLCLLIVCLKEDHPVYHPFLIFLADSLSLAPTIDSTNAPSPLITASQPSSPLHQLQLKYMTDLSQGPSVDQHHNAYVWGALAQPKHKQGSHCHKQHISPTHQLWFWQWSNATKCWQQLRRHGDKQITPTNSSETRISETWWSELQEKWKSCKVDCQGAQELIILVYRSHCLLTQVIVPTYLQMGICDMLGHKLPK